VNPSFCILLFRVWLACGMMAVCGVLHAGEKEPRTIRELQMKAATEPFEPLTVHTSGIVTWIDPI